MTHHMLPGFGRDWIASCRNAFLIRDPVDVLASYAEKRAELTLADIGIAEQVELFERESRPPRDGPAGDRIGGRARRSRAGRFRRCARRSASRSSRPCCRGRPAGAATDGVWAPAWYDAVERSTGFGPPGRKRAFEELQDELKPIAEAARPLYERLAAHRLR